MAVKLDDFDLDQLITNLENARHPHQKNVFISTKEISNFLESLKANGDVSVSRDEHGDEVYTFGNYRNKDELTEALKSKWANFKEAEYLAEQHQYIDQNRSNAPQTSTASPQNSNHSRDSGFFEANTPNSKETDVEHNVDYSSSWDADSPMRENTPDLSGLDISDNDDHSSIVSSSRSSSRRDSMSTISSTSTEPISPELTQKLDTDSTATQQEPLKGDLSRIGADALHAPSVVLTYVPYTTDPRLMIHSTTSDNPQIQKLVSDANKFTIDIAYEMQKAAKNSAKLEQLTSSLNEHYNGMIANITEISHGVPPQTLRSPDVQVTRSSTVRSSTSTAPIPESSRPSSPTISPIENTEPSAHEFGLIETAQAVKLDEATAARVQPVAATEIHSPTNFNSQRDKSSLVITRTPFEGSETLMTHSTTSNDLRIQNVVRDANKFTIDIHYSMQKAAKNGDAEKLQSLTQSLQDHYDKMALTITFVHGRQPSFQTQATISQPTTNLSHHSPAAAPQVKYQQDGPNATALGAGQSHIERMSTANGPHQVQNSPTPENAIQSYVVKDPAYGDAYKIYFTTTHTEQSQRLVDKANTTISELLTITRNSMGNPDAYKMNSNLLNAYYSKVDKAVAAYNDREHHPQKNGAQAVINDDSIALKAAQRYVEKMRAANGAHQFPGGLQQENLTENTPGNHTLVPVHANNSHTWSVEIPEPAQNPPQKRMGKLWKIMNDLLRIRGIKPVIGKIMKINMSRSQNQTQDKSQHVSEGQQPKKPGRTH